MKKIRLILTGLLLLCSTAIFAQNITVTGTVTDASNGQVVPGVTVLLKSDMSVWATTDDKGVYSISVPTNGIIQFSLSGYETLEMPVNGKAKIDASLKMDVQQFDDVIVVAYGTSTKASFTGSATMVNSEKIEKRVTSNVTSALAGTTPGVQVISSNGDPARNGNTIRIRGIGSMSASSAPLIILDGMPYEGSIKDINSSDVESMSVLKDASASAIYGARGANGVILITTKKAKGNTLPNVKLDARWGSNSRLIPQYDVISDPKEYYETYYKLMWNSQHYIGKTDDEAYEFANRNIFNRRNGGLGYQVYTIPDGEDFIGRDFKMNPNAKLGYSDGEYYYTPDDWYNEAFHNSFRHEYNLSISGSTDKLSYYASAGFLDDGGIVNNSNYKRYSARINAEYQAKKWLKFTTNMGYSHSDSQTPSYSGSFGSSGNLFYIVNNIAPIYPLYVRNADGSIKEINGRKQYDANQTNFKRPGFVGNAVRDNEYDQRKSYGDMFNGKWGIVITPVKGLNITGNVGLTNDNGRSNLLFSPFGSGSNTDGAVAVSHSRYFSVNSQALISYKTDFGGSRSHFDILAGYENFSVLNQGLSAGNTHLFNPFIGELDNAGTITEQSTGSDTDHYRTQGFLFRAQYDWDGRYFISASYRRDASSRFAEGHRWGNFGSVGAAWNIASEPFMENADWVDLLKLKASWGVQGNDDIGGYYPYADQYSHTYDEDSGEYSLNLGYKGNKDLTWETSHAVNVGIDFGFFTGRLNGSIEFFDRITTDMLYARPVPLSAGNPTGIIPVNVGSMKNIGVELNIDGDPIRTRNFEWNINLNLTHYKNEILSLDKSIEENGIKGSSSIIRVGGSRYNAYMRKFAGVDKETGEGLYYYQEKDENGKPFGELKTTTEFTEADQFDLGTVLPKIFGGFGTTLSFYGIDISAQFSFQLGGRYYDGSYQALMHTQDAPGKNMHKDLLNSWSETNRDSNIPRMDGSSIVGQSTVDRFLISSNYISLNNLQVGYTFPKKWMSKIKVGSLRIYVAGENLFVKAARKGIDPRFSYGLGSYTSGSGLNSGAYGSMRNITGGISITF